MLTAFDVGIGVLVLISALLATARGFTREVLSLATWAGSAAIGAYLALYQYELVRQYFADEMIGRIVLGVGAFVVALIVLHLITMSIADFVVDSRIGPLDRTLGFVFGVARGVLIAVVFVVFGANLLNFQTQAWATESRSWPILTDLGDRLMAALPPDLEQQASQWLRRDGGDADSPDENTPAGAPPDESTDLPEDATPPATNT
jgi:membrane protein required for colicin V production